MTITLQGQERLRSAMRVAVAVCALLIFAGDSNEHPARRPFASATLALFMLYALVVYVVATRRGRSIPVTVAAWIDLGWVTALIAVSQGTSGVFYPLYLFPILYAAFGRGLRVGVVLTVAAVASFAIVGAGTAPRTPGFDLNAFVSRPLYLLLLGYLTSVWGGYEVRSRSRLALLRDVTSLSNPRFGIDRTILRFLEALRRHHDADACLFVVADQGGQGRLWTASRNAGDRKPAATPLPSELAGVLLPDLPGLVLHAHRRGWPHARQLAVSLEPGLPPADATARETAERLADLLEAGAVLSSRFRYHASAKGWLHVARRAPRAFDPEEITFVRHVLDQVVPMLESVRLVDRLASDAAEEERRRIARDLHDSVIQPYLGLRLGLTAAQRALADGRVAEGSAAVDRLVSLADGEIQTLRGYVRGLREGAGEPHGSLLDEGLRRFCSRFSDATGIRVDVQGDGATIGSDRLAAEVFQIVAEGLSNVRRHTSASAATVSIRAAENRLRVTIANDGAQPGEADFLPRSLAERAAALGGSVTVERPAGSTAVRVEIPL